MGLWRPPDLQLALNWREKQQPTVPWAVQYDPAFERAMVFLETSDAEFRKEEENKVRLQKRRLRVTRIFSLVLGGIAVVAMGLFLQTKNLQSREEAARKDAENKAEEARIAEEAALAARDSADLERQKAENALQLAEERRVEAENATLLAEDRRIEAESERTRAEQNADAALRAGTTQCIRSRATAKPCLTSQRGGTKKEDALHCQVHGCEIPADREHR